MKRILVLTDFSETAESAVRSAFILARKYDAGLIIYHQMTDGERVSYDLRNLSLHHLSTGEAKIASAWSALSDQYNVETKYIIGVRHLVTDINDICNDHNIDMIIMGSTGAGGKEEYLWGSNTEDVVSKADHPVLIIKQPMRDYKIDNLVFASSFNEDEREVFTHALSLMPPTDDATIHLLSIDTATYITQPDIVVKSAMNDFAELAKPYRTEMHFYRDYSIDAGVRHFLDKVKPDILIMSNKNTNPVKKFFLGSNTLRIALHASYPVLTIDY